MKKLEMAGEVAHAANLALQQNHVPLVKAILLKNLGDEDLIGVSVSAATEPEASKPWERKADVFAGGSVLLQDVDIRLSVPFLADLTEKMACSLKFKAELDGEVLAEESFDVEFLCKDEWSADASIPEILAAFATPNHSFIGEVLRKAAEVLGGWGEPPAFTGYQSKDPFRVRTQMAAIYASLQSEGIAYCPHPASFESSGQRVGLCDAVKAQKLGTCLDTALLYVGCLEAAGLHPLLVVLREHALTGCWLEDDTFSESVQDDVTALSKRVSEGLICIVETTCTCLGKAASFDQACEIGKQSCRSQSSFSYLVDVARARVGGIVPLPLSSGFSMEEEDWAEAVVAAKPEEQESARFAPEKLAPKSIIMQQMWERKLLDLSLHNSLINFRASRSSL